MGNIALQRELSKGNQLVEQKRSHSASSGKANHVKKTVKETKNERLVRVNWLEACNLHDSSIVSKFSQQDALCTFKGATHSMTMPHFLQSCDDLWTSFPDNKMKWQSCKELRPGVVFVENFQGTGTHTGPAYSFGPYPPIPTSLRTVEENPCHLTIKVKRGKMVHIEIDPYCSDLVGPPGYYMQIGGDLGAVSK